MPVSFVDLDKRPPSAGELRRFSDRFGAEALLDQESKAYRKAGLGYLRMDEREVLGRLSEDPALLRLPLVRFGDDVTVGVDEPAWRGWHAAFRERSA